MKDVTGEIRSNPETGNAWKVIDDTEEKLRVKCVQGPDEGEYKKVNRVSFLEGLLNPDNF